MAEELSRFSTVRSGLKRELAFALKAQAELSPMGRTRSGKIRRASPFPQTLSAVSYTRKGRRSDVDGSKTHYLPDLVAESPVLIGEEPALMRDAEGVVSCEWKMSDADGRKNPSLPILVPESPVLNEDEPALVNDVEVMVCDERKAIPIEEAFKNGTVGDGLDEMKVDEGVEQEKHPLVSESVGEETTRTMEVNDLGCHGRENVEGTGADLEIGAGDAMTLWERKSTDGSEAETQMAVDYPGEQRPHRALEKPSCVMIPNTEDSVMESEIEVNASNCVVKFENFVKPEKPFRRFTRSLLKSTAEEPPATLELSSTVTSSSCSEGSDGTRDGDSNMENGMSRSRRTLNKKELKMSKKISLTKLPTNARQLLATGFLDGLTVKCNSSSKKARELRGVIKDGRIICSCSSCKGIKAVSACQFQLHCGSCKKPSSDNIFLESGSTIHDLLRACTSAPLNMLESIIQNAICSETSSHPTVCQQCNESFLPSTSHSGKLLSTCDSCLAERLTPTHSSPISVAHKNTRFAKSSLAAVSSDCLSNNTASQKTSGRGRVTRKDLGLHKLVFMDNILPDGMEVAYYNRGQRLLEGYIKGSGIFCNCCSSVVSPSQFEAHAGWATRRKPYLNIYTSNGVSLHELSVSLSKDKKFAGRENDDLCRVCADGGDLLLCDVCPRAFHIKCVGLSSIPKGDWYCPCCESMHQREGFVAHNDNAIAAGRVSGVDPIEQIFTRCVRIVQMPETDSSSCVLCKCHDFSRSEFGPRTVLICDQCEKEFHIGCLKDHNIVELEELPKGEWFCCLDCNETHAALKNFLLSGLQQFPDTILETVKRKRIEKGLSNENDLDVRWRLLNGKMDYPDCRLLLSKAISVFHESFDPIFDLSTGQDLIPAMVYGKNMKDQDFGGMYCAVLTVNSSVVSAAILRVFGRDAAELPLVATTTESQGHGYFQSLFSCIETLLESLNVKHLVLPATKEAEAIWIKKFGFSEITLKKLEEYTKGSRIMSFQGTPVLHKPILSQNTGQGETQ